MKKSRLAVCLVQILVLFVVGYYLIYRNLVQNWNSLAGQEWSLHWTPFMFSLLAVSLIFLFNSLVWRMIVFALSGRRIGAWRAAYIWFISNLGRYLPGKVWQIAGMAVLARREGVPAVSSTASAVIGQVVHLLAGSAVGLVLLPAGLTGRLAPLLEWAWLGIPPVLAVLWPPLLKKILRLADRWTGAEHEVEYSFRLRDVLLWFVLNVGVWLAYGLAFHYFVLSVLPGSQLTPLAATGIYAVGYIAGFLVVVAPGGLGVREVLFAGLLAALLGRAEATVVALGSRIWLTLAELIPVAVALAAGGLPAGSRGKINRESDDG